MSLSRKEAAVAAFATAMFSTMIRENRGIGLQQLLDGLAVLGEGDHLSEVNKITAEEVRAIALKVKAQADWSREAVRALGVLVDTVDCTGGVKETETGLWTPVADETWIDMGTAYELACEVLGKPMKKHESGDAGEGD